MKATKATQAAAIIACMSFGFFLHPPRLSGAKMGGRSRTADDTASLSIPAFVRWGSEVESDKAQIQAKVGNKLKVLMYLESAPIL